MNHHSADVLNALLAKGVEIPRPGGVEIASDVNPERVSGEGVTIHAGCRIRGATTLIRSGVELGADGAVALTDCQLGRDVALRAGTFERATFLDGAGMGPGAQVREGCLLEEGARGAHTVGLKQTILFPFVTLGSLVNFCDCLMAGGTNAKDHSEVGSSYIHFNYTPNQDKATPSMIGDVARGVMVSEPPIFLGGQGGLVGPVRISYGTIVAAGTILRRDVLERERLVVERPKPGKGSGRARRHPRFRRGRYGDLARILRWNVLYTAELVALTAWYRHVRFSFAGAGTPARAVLEAAADRIEGGIEERIRRLGQLAEIVEGSEESVAARFHRDWPRARDALEAGRGGSGDSGRRDGFLATLNSAPGRSDGYLAAVRSLDDEGRAGGTAWLQDLTDGLAGPVLGILDIPLRP